LKQKKTGLSFSRPCALTIEAAVNALANGEITEADLSRGAFLLTRTTEQALLDAYTNESEKQHPTEFAKVLAAFRHGTRVPFEKCQWSKYELIR
jgi:hypothetical protein